MKHTEILKISFLKIASQQTGKPALEGIDLENGLGSLGTGMGAVGGFQLGKGAGGMFADAAKKILPDASAGMEAAKSIIPAGSKGLIPDSIKRLGVTKSHGSKLMSALALLAPMLGMGFGAGGGGAAGRDIGRTLDGKQ